MQTIKAVSSVNLSAPAVKSPEDEGYHLLVDRITGALIVKLASGAIGDVSVAQPDADGDPVTANPTVIAGVDGGGIVRTVRVLADGSLQVDIADATIVGGNILVELDSSTDSVEVLQSTHDNLNGNANLQVGNVDVGAGNPVPISAASLPLPTGAATETTLDNIDTVSGATADAAVVTDTTGTLSGKLRGLVKWAFERMPAALGQTTMAASLPVTLASNQSAVPIVDPGSANLVLVSPSQSVKTVSASGTPEALGGATRFRKAVLVGNNDNARTANTGNVYVGCTSTNDQQPFVIEPGGEIIIQAPYGCCYQLSDWYIDVATNDDGVVMTLS